VHRLKVVHEMRPIATDVARSLVCVCLCVPVCWCWVRGWAVQKRLNGPKCRLGLTYVGQIEPCVRWVNLWQIHLQPRGMTMMAMLQKSNKGCAIYYIPVSLSVEFMYRVCRPTQNKWTWWWWWRQSWWSKPQAARSRSQQAKRTCNLHVFCQFLAHRILFLQINVITYPPYPVSTPLFSPSLHIHSPPLSPLSVSIPPSIFIFSHSVPWRIEQCKINVDCRLLPCMQINIFSEIPDDWTFFAEVLAVWHFMLHRLTNRRRPKSYFTQVMLFSFLDWLLKPINEVFEK